MDDLPTGVQLMEFDPEFRADPYPRLAELQRRCPVRYDPVLETVILTRYDEVRAVINDRTLWRHPERVKPRKFYAAARTSALQSQSILMMDEPGHSRIRHPLAQAFNRRASQMREKVETIVGETLDALMASDRFDLVESFAAPVPILTIAAVLGVESDRLHDFRDWSVGIGNVFNVMRTPDEEHHLTRSTEALAAFLNASFEERRRRPRDDLITDLVQLHDSGDAVFTEEELNINLRAMLVAGNLTTTDLIANGVRVLLDHPEQLADVKADPHLIGQAVEEILRFDPPITFTGRVSSREIELGGHRIPPREALLSYLRAANRDPAYFEHPDRFDIHRRHVPHVAFGGGSHICIGAPLARLEARVALQMLFDRFPNLHLADRDFVWRAIPGFRGATRIEVRTSPPAGSRTARDL